MRMHKRQMQAIGSLAVIVVLVGCADLGATAASDVDAAPLVNADDSVSPEPSPPVPEDPASETHIHEGEELTLSLPSDVAGGATIADLEVNDGWDVTADVVALDGGSIIAESDPWGRLAFRYPPFSTSPDPARAIIRITPQSDADPDPLAPGTADFTFGADFAIDAESQGTEVDGGNNLIQRGLASDPSQYKIDVDDDRPMCRIEGSQGVVELRITEQVDPGVWYRARCARVDELVQFTVFVMGDSPTILETVTARAPTGHLEWTLGTPLSVGGKLSAAGEVIRSDTDQFNGVVRAPVLLVEDGP